MKHLCRVVGMGMMAVLTTTLLSSIVWAQTKRPMTIVDLVNVPSLSDPQLSPDGTQVLYVLAEPDWK